MRRAMLIAVLGLLCCAPLTTFAYCAGQPPSVPLADESLTIGATAIGLTALKYQQTTGTAIEALVTIDTAPIRFWVDGSTPTSSAGHPAPASTSSATSSFTLCGIESISKFKAIRSTGVSAVAQVSYFKKP